MRKIAMITTALVGLAFATPNPTFAQGAESAPVSGLPPGASVGAGNAQPPAATGVIKTTRVGPATVTRRPPVVRTPRRTPRRRFFSRRPRATAPATPATPPAQ